MGKHIKYSNETRMKAVQMKLDGIPTSIIVEQLNIRDQRRVGIWLKRYLSGDTTFVDKRGKKSKNGLTHIKDKSEMTKDEYIAYLEMENDILKYLAEKEIEQLSMK